MGPLAPSHTLGSPTGRRLLTMLVVLVLAHHSIVAVASDSENLQGVGGVSRKFSLARFRIRSAQVGPNDSLDRIGSEGTSPEEIRPPAIEIRPLEGWRKVLGDISPPGMWPTPDGQDDVLPVVNDELRRRSLLTLRTSLPPIGPWFVVMHSSQDGEDSFLRQALVADKTYPVVHWALIVNKLQQLGTLITRSSLSFGIRLPGSWRVDAVAAADSSEQIEHGHQHLQTVTESIVVPNADRTSPDTLGNEMLPSIGHFEESTSLQPKIPSDEPKFRSRRLQGDISPPGMWSDSDDDESQLS